MCSFSRRRASASPSRWREIKDASFVPEEAYVGLFLSSHNPDVKESVVFRHVRVIKPVKVGFQPYRDYIGSRLEVMNVTSGHRNVYYTSQVPFEAPNWLPDGSALIYNASGGDPATRGRLWKFDLLTRTPSLDRHRLRDPQQQRPRAVLRRHAARDQRPEPGAESIHHLHDADARRRDQAHHAEHA